MWMGGTVRPLSFFLLRVPFRRLGSPGIANAWIGMTSVLIPEGLTANLGRYFHRQRQGRG